MLVLVGSNAPKCPRGPMWAFPCPCGCPKMCIGTTCVQFLAIYVKSDMSNFSSVVFKSVEYLDVIEELSSNTKDGVHKCNYI